MNTVFQEKNKIKRQFMNDKPVRLISKRPLYITKVGIENHLSIHLSEYDFDEKAMDALLQGLDRRKAYHYIIEIVEKPWKENH